MRWMDGGMLEQQGWMERLDGGGVPWGSIIGPAVFIVFNGELGAGVEGSFCIDWSERVSKVSRASRMGGCC